MDKNQTIDSEIRQEIVDFFANHSAISLLIILTWPVTYKNRIKNFLSDNKYKKTLMWSMRRDKEELKV